ncbi:MAG: S-adenosylmethionine decarboxylase [Gemmatimonadetes bacterium]|nr:S-adenosylmethionine decarboxylase [Gemmatimonadota bacterium]
MSTSTPRETFTSDESLGREWIVEARGCDPSALKDLPTLRRLFERIIDEMGLNEVRPSVWHVFPGAGGITGMSLLAESHLTCHTFPEHGTVCLNLFCCRPRPEWDFAEGLAEVLDADDVHVRSVARRFAPEAAGVIDS